MSDTKSSEGTHGARWIVATTCGVLALIVVVGGMLAMRDGLLIKAREESRAQTSEREKLAARISTLQSTVDTLSTQPKPDEASLAAVDTKLAEITTTLEALSARVAVLEKKPEAVPVAVAPIAPPPVVTVAAAPTGELVALKLAAMSGKPFATELAAWSKLHPDAKDAIAPLNAVAESGIVSETELNRTLRVALDDATRSTKIDDVSTLGKINTHMAGLVSIKKAADVGPYTSLRANVLRDDITLLTHAVEALDASARKPLEVWLATAHARRDALAALATLDTMQGR
jgi:outer membrane murein-binding lipoprotein Lpp